MYICYVMILLFTVYIFLFFSISYFYILFLKRFVSKEREQLRTFCGWEGDALLQSLVEGLEEQNYFEKAAAIALWYYKNVKIVGFLQL